MNETLNKKYQCEHCEYNTNHSSHFKRHIKMVHDKIKDFHCNKCDASFSTNSCLKIHIKIVHDKIKDYHCNICDYSCSINSHLQQHIKLVHDKIKDYHCNLCDKSFSTNGELKRHIKAVHDKIKDFHCDKCDYSCSTNGQLQRHIKTCTGKQTRFSSGEFQVNKALNELGFIENDDYIFNQTFHPLSQYANKNLRPDFRFINHKIILEYDGQQHFRSDFNFGASKEKSDENFKQIQINDKLKDDFCKDNEYKMIRISYKDFPNILSILSKELFDIVDWTG